MKKVLIVINTEFTPYGGLTTVMMNYYKYIDKSELQIDIASTNVPVEVLLSEIKKYGSRYFNLGKRKKSPIKYLHKLHQLLKRERYDVIHVNGNSATMALELCVAKICKIPVRIAHGHTTRSNYPKMHKILAPFFKKTYTDAIANSKDTGEWLFGKEYIILNNAIDVSHYEYSKEVRERKRKELDIEGNFVIGNVGKLNAPKNQSFLIDIFKEISKKKDDVKLVIVGGGSLEGQLKQKCKEEGLEEAVLFLGMLNDASDVLQTFDVFVFTSIFEGLGLALIEAQASGLECVSSDVVPQEATVSDHVQYLSLQETPSYWADKILQVLEYNREEYSLAARRTIRECGYDVQYEAEKLAIIYGK